jgi:hypothetical protein
MTTTTLITKLYATPEAADAVRKDLSWRGFPPYQMRVFTKRKGDTGKALAAKMAENHVASAAATAYAKKVMSGGALLVVMADYRPLNALRIAREVIGDSEPVESGVAEEEYKIDPGKDHAPSIFRHHPHILTTRREDSEPWTPRFTEQMGWPLLSSKPRRSSVISGGRFMSKRFWPGALLRTKPRRSSVFSGGRYMSKRFWPMPLISDKPRKLSVIKGGDIPLSRVLRWPPIVK